MSARRRRSRYRVLHIALLVPVVASVTVATTVRTANAAGGAKELPPSTRNELVRTLAPKVAPLGMHITRAALVDSQNRRSASGTHLALYVEPDGAYSPGEYVDGIAPVSRAFLPLVFHRWPGLRSFDVCQEPLPAIDNRSEPPPETQVFVRRRRADALDWKHADLATLLAEGARASRRAGDSGQVDFTVFVAKHLQSVPEFEHAFARATSEIQSEPTSSTHYR